MLFKNIGDDVLRDRLRRSEKQIVNNGVSAVPLWKPIRRWVSNPQS